MTIYLIAYDLSDQTKTFVPQKIAEVLSGELFDLSLPRNPKKGLGTVESFVFVLSTSANPAKAVEFLSKINCQDKDFDLLFLNDGGNGENLKKTLREQIASLGGKLFTEKEIATQNKTRSALEEETQTFAFEISKL